MVAKPTKPVRGKDRGKLMEKLGDWIDPVRVGEFENYQLLYLPNPKDLALLGQLMHHCSGTHFIWACEEKIWYFFALVNEKGVPIATLHTKEEKWLGKPHPRDSGKPLPPGVTVFNPNGGYPRLEDYEAGFGKAGLKYKPGIYKPISYNSQTYEVRPGEDYSAGGFDSKWYNPMTHRPDGITEELFGEFTRCWKAMADHYNKTAGIVKVQGRTFYFDGKKQIVLSLSGGAQSQVQVGVRRMVFEWLNQHQKKSEAPKLD